MKDDTRRLIWGVFGVFTGCGLNNIALEVLIRADPAAGQLITAAQFACITAVGLCSHVLVWDSKSRCMLRWKCPEAPLRHYILLTLLFAAVSLLNNFVFMFRISLPFHMIFRSSSLVASMALGLFFFGKKYGKQQILSCIMITVGIVLATLADAPDEPAGVVKDQVIPSLQECCGASNELLRSHCDTVRCFLADHAGVQSHQHAELISWSIGVGLMFVTLMLSALLGHLQQQGYVKYGRHPEESLFYSHMLPLPLALLGWSHIKEHIFVLKQAAPFVVSLGSRVVSIPMLGMLLVNVITQYLCVRSVYTLTCFSNTLSCTFTITIRKFFSLIVSIFYFGNTFNHLHLFGTIVVFAGTFLYVTSKNAFQASSSVTKTKKTQ